MGAGFFQKIPAPRTVFLILFFRVSLSHLGKGDRHFKEIAVQVDLEGAALHLGQGFGDGQSQPAPLRAAGDIPPDKPLRQLIL